MVTFANVGSVRLPSLKFVQAFAFGRYGAFSVSAVYLQQFQSYSNHNCKKSSFLRTPAFIFCLLWGRPCGNHAKRCMNEKTIQCLPNPSQHVPIYLQLFPSYSNRKCKKSPFSRTAAHIFVSPGDAPAIITQYVLGWKDNSMLTNYLAACAHLTIAVSEIERDIGRKSPFFHTPCIRRPRQGGSRRNIATPFGMENQNGLAIRQRKNFEDTFIRFVATHERDRHTDRHRMPAYTALMHSIAR